MKNNAPAEEGASSYFYWRDKAVRQDEGVFKIGTDSLLLGGWIPRVVPDATRILDAGTGTGILAIMMHSAFPEALVEAIDVSAAAVQCAQDNLALADTHGLMTVRLEDLIQERPFSGSLFDLIVSNPPYFTTGQPSVYSERASARHLMGGISAWVNGLCARISPQGHIGIVVPYPDVFDWTTEFNRIGFYVRTRADVKTFPTDDFPVRTLLHLTQQLYSPALMQITLRESGGSYTREYLDLTGLRTTSK